jgi:hypothetical protein
MAEIQGGRKFEAYLEHMARQISTANSVKVGFLSSATYPNGTPVAMIAAIQNWGAPSVGIPARPFFTDMISKKSPEWPAAIAGLLKSHDYDAASTLRLTGEAVVGQLRQSIRDLNDPPLAPSTIKRKGFSKPLISTGHLLQSVDYEVKS